MKSCYIHSAVSISTQPTFESDLNIVDFIEISGKICKAIYPDYKKFISPMALRRMATGVKMGVASAQKALDDVQISEPDAILTGTGMGCIEDTEKFLNNIIANDEEFLTPTSFIQSTHNTVGAQIALGLKCKSYNSTYVHGALSFESALMDGLMLIQQEEAKNVLVGGVDELGDEFVNSVRMLEDQNPKGIQVPIGEGASFFVMSSEKSKNDVELLDVQSFSMLPKDALDEKLKMFLNQNNLSASEIDGLILGKNGDAFDDYYSQLNSYFPSSVISVDYKRFVGEFFTASAFGLYLGYSILKSPSILKSLCKLETSSKPIKTILLYNQFKGRDHSFILLRSC